MKYTQAICRISGRQNTSLAKCREKVGKGNENSLPTEEISVL